MKTKRILVVDDEVNVTRTMKVILERAGTYLVQTENQATHALAAARAFHPDLVLLDVMMPDMSGGAVAAQIHADAALKHVPIVFLTGIVNKKDAGDEGIEVGGQRFLAKPVNLSALINCIEANTKS